MKWYLIEGINPEPWTASEASIGRKNGKMFVQFHKSEALRSYQEAIKSEMERWYPEVKPTPTGQSVNLSFFLWRQLPEYETDKRKVRKHTADATNMQKALEDALQGVLYENDRDVVSISTRIIEQTATADPKILVCVVNASHFEAHWKGIAVAMANDIIAARPQPEVEPQRVFPDDDLF